MIGPSNNISAKNANSTADYNDYKSDMSFRFGRKDTERSHE